MEGMLKHINFILSSPMHPGFSYPSVMANFSHPYDTDGFIIILHILILTAFS
jgi:hypothetical protein